MTYDQTKLVRVAETRGRYRMYIGEGDTVRCADRVVNGPAVLVVSRSRVEVIPCRYRKLHRGVWG